MTRRRLIEYLHELARIERYPFLKRFHGRARARALWDFNRTSVARGVAVGFFFGILTPVAQIVFSILVAIVLRANVVVAAGSTLITNPFILPFVYYYAYRIGFFLTQRDQTLVDDVAVSEEASEHALDVTDWVPTLMDWFSSVGYPLLIGVVCLSLAAASSGFVLVHAVWALAQKLPTIGKTADQKRC